MNNPMLLIYLILFSFSFSQDRQSEFKFARVKSLMSAGKNAEALTEMKALYSTNPNNRQYINQYVQLLKTQNQLPEVIKLFEYQLLQKPSHLNYTLELAGAYFESGAKEKAQSLWTKASSELASQIHHFSQVANSLLQHRLYEEAIAVYQLARVKVKQPSTFLINIAQLQQYVFKYSDALETYLELLRLQPAQYNIVSGRIFQLFELPEAIPAIDNFLKKLNVNRLAEAQLKSDILIKNKRYSEALTLLQKPIFKSGNLLYNYADQMRILKEFEFSEKAFQHLIRSTYEPHHKDNARIGLTSLKIDQYNTLKSLHLKDSIATIIDNLVADIISTHNNITDLRLIYAEHLLRDRLDAEKSYTIIHPIISKDKLRASNPYASIILADIYFMKRDLEKSKFILDNFSNKLFEGQKYYKLAGIALINKQHEQLRDMLSKLIQSSEGLKNLYVNDMIQLFLEASSLSKNDKLFSNYGQVFYYYQTNQYQNALTEIDKLIEISPDFKLNGDRLKFSLFLKMDQLENCLLIAQSYLNSNQQDEWQLKEAKVLLKQNKRDNAKDILTQLILSFPAGFWTNEARKILQDII